MKLKSRLIYKSESTCFQTSLPVHFYGMSNGKMVILFTHCKYDFPYDATLKWILAEHMDFSYNYESNTILTNDYHEVGIIEFMELADNLEQRIKTIATFGNFSSGTEAQQYFNINANNMLISQSHTQVELNYY
jgi:hypothetical protein